MASELPSGVLGNLATSVKNIVTGHSDDVQATETAVEETTTVEAPVVKKADHTVEAHADNTTIHKEKASAVVHEDVKSHQHEQVDTIVDKEIHQDHYHTTLLPVKDTKVLPTKHVYQDNEAEREIDHRDSTAKKAAKQEAHTIHNEKHVEGTTHSKEVAPTQENEHIHHHIHETIQPVIERDVYREKVIHTTNHVHETEHLNDQFHEASIAPAITMADFEKAQAGSLGASKTDRAEVEEKPVTRSATVSKEVTMSDYKNGGTGTIVNSKKRDATDDIDIDAATKVGKLDATEASNPTTQ